MNDNSEFARQLAASIEAEAAKDPMTAVRAHVAALAARRPVGDTTRLAMTAEATERLMADVIAQLGWIVK